MLTKSYLAALKNNSREGGAPCGLGQGEIHSFMQLWDSGVSEAESLPPGTTGHILITHLTHTAFQTAHRAHTPPHGCVLSAVSMTTSKCCLLHSESAEPSPPRQVRNGSSLLLGLSPPSPSPPCPFPFHCSSLCHVFHSLLSSEDTIGNKTLSKMR